MTVLGVARVDLAHLGDLSHEQGVVAGKVQIRGTQLLPGHVPHKVTRLYSKTKKKKVNQTIKKNVT